jgi:DNA-binding transcriptional ArsR family regulator
MYICAYILINMNEKLISENNVIDLLASELDDTLFKALSEPVRVELIKLLLVKGPSDIGDIAQAFTQDRSVISRHLKLLLEVGMVTCLKKGKHHIYQLNGLKLISKFELILKLAKDAISNCCPLNSNLK